MRSSLIIHPEELSREWIDRAADAGIDVLGIHPKGGKRAPVYVREMMEMMKTREYRELIDYARERGIEIEYEIHAASYLLPRELFVENPQFFRMNEQGMYGCKTMLDVPPTYFSAKKREDLIAELL